MTPAELLKDAFARVAESVETVVDGLTEEQLAARPGPEANSIAWLVWHLTRVQDDHLADAFGLDQVWLAQDWQKRFGLDLPPRDIGYGHSPAQVAEVRVDSADLLIGYHDAVHAQSLQALRGVGAADLDRVVDRRWDPPVTLGVRLVSVLSDDLQHVGQAAYVRGLLQSAAE